jgi:hypothetical protein
LVLSSIHIFTILQIPVKSIGALTMNILRNKIRLLLSQNLRVVVLSHCWHWFDEIVGFTCACQFYMFKVQDCHCLGHSFVLSGRKLFSLCTTVKYRCQQGLIQHSIVIEHVPSLHDLKYLINVHEPYSLNINRPELNLILKILAYRLCDIHEGTFSSITEVMGTWISNFYHMMYSIVINAVLDSPVNEIIPHFCGFCQVEFSST